MRSYHACISGSGDCKAAHMSTLYGGEVTTKSMLPSEISFVLKTSSFTIFSVSFLKNILSVMLTHFQCKYVLLLTFLRYSSDIFHCPLNFFSVTNVCEDSV